MQRNSHTGLTACYRGPLLLEIGIHLGQKSVRFQDLVKFYVVLLKANVIHTTIKSGPHKLTQATLIRDPVVLNQGKVNENFAELRRRG